MLYASISKVKVYFNALPTPAVLQSFWIKTDFFWDMEGRRWPELSFKKCMIQYRVSVNRSATSCLAMQLREAEYF